MISLNEYEAMHMRFEIVINILEKIETYVEIWVDSLATFVLLSF